jgi:hypothetical protein
MYTSLNVIMVIKYRGMRWTVRVARLERIRNACKISVGKRGGMRRQLRTPGRRWKNDNKTGL